MNQLKQKFMVVLRAETVKSVREFGVTFLLEDSPVLLLDRLLV